MTTTFLISADLGVRVLDESGWRAPVHGECIDTGDGNELTINAEGYWTGAVQGYAAGVLTSLIVLGIVAAVIEATR